MALRFEEAALLQEKFELEQKKKRTASEDARLEEVTSLLKKKIISVTLTQSLVKRIDDLVQERVGRSRAQLIEDSVRWYLDFSVHKWSPRGIYVNSIRMHLESEALASLYFSQLTPAAQYELGRTAGSQAPIADVMKLYYGKDTKDAANRDLVLGLLQDNGWGEIRQQDDLIVIGSPFHTAQFCKGYLEELLKVNLESVETNVKENLVLRIVK